jgi:hypothetical protein
VSTLVICVLTMAIMLPNFLPKILIGTTIERPKILRLNRLVSAYPSSLNPMGLTSGLSFRLPMGKNTRKAAAANIPLAAGDASSGNPRTEPRRSRVSFLVPMLPTSRMSRGSQGTSHSTSFADSSRELVRTNSSSPKATAGEDSVEEGIAMSIIKMQDEDESI